MKAPLALIELWSDLPCASGARRAFVERPLAASMELRLRGDSRAQFDLPLDDAAIAYVTGGAVAIFRYADGTYDEWRIDRLTTEVGPGGEVRRVQLAAPLWDLGFVGPITEYDSLGNPTFSGTRYQITPSDLITTVILPWLTANGVTWVSLGTIDPTTTIDIDWDTVTPLGLLHQLEDATKTEVQLRRNGTTDYKLDLLTTINGAQPVADLRHGKNLLATTLTEDATQRYSSLTGLGAADPAGRRAVIGRAVWEVTAVDTGTDELTLTDPEGGDDPILEDDQLNGLYLYDLPSGRTDQILDTIEATQEVEVADASLYTVGDLLEVRRGAGSGTFKDNAPLLTSLSRPSITPPRAGMLDRPDLYGERNLLRNGWFTDWTGGVDEAPDGWTLHAGALDHDVQESTYAELGPYTVALKFQPWQISLTPMTSGDDTLQDIDTTYFYVGQTVEVYGMSGTVETFTIVSFPTATSIEFSGTVSYTHSNGTWVRGVGATFPIFQGPNTYAWPGMASDVVRAPVTGGSIFWAQAKVMIAGFAAGQYRALLIVERYSSTDILLARIEAQTTVMDQWVTLGCSVQAAAGEQLRVLVELRDDPTYPTLVTTYLSPPTARLLVDGACLTQTDYQPAGIPNYSFANAFWQAVNRALAANSAGTSYEVDIVDLTALDATGWPHDELLIGGTVRVNQARAGVVNQSLRIVELLRPNLFQPAGCRVVLNQRRTDLTEIIDRATRVGGGAATPGGGGSGGGSGTPASPSTVPVKVPFHAAGDSASPYTLALGTHGAAVAEVDDGLRTWIDTNTTVKMRIETVVDTVGATGAEIAAQYSTDGGTTWNYFDGVDGPFVAIDATGAVAGAGVVPVVRGDVLTRLVMRGGDTVESPVLRNTMLYLWYAVLAAAVSTPTPPLVLPAPSAGCAIAGGIEYEGNLAAYTDYDDFYNTRGDDLDGTLLFGDWYAPSTASAEADFDTGRTFNGAPAMMGLWRDNGGSNYDGTPWTTYYTTAYNDVTVFLVFEIESGFDNSQTAQDNGLAILSHFTDAPGGAGTSNSAGIYLRSGRVYFDWGYSFSSHSAAVDLGPTSDWTGAKKQLVMRLERIDASNIEVTIALNDTCTTPTILHQAQYPASHASNAWESVNVWEDRMMLDLPASPGKTIWWWQWGYDTNSATYGL